MWPGVRTERKHKSMTMGPIPRGEPAIRTIAMPADTNPAGGIFGG
jgi:acyl-CoA thioesterase YciA